MRLCDSKVKNEWADIWSMNLLCTLYQGICFQFSQLLIDMRKVLHYGCNKWLVLMNMHHIIKPF